MSTNLTTLAIVLWRATGYAFAGQDAPRQDARPSSRAPAIAADDAAPLAAVSKADQALIAKQKTCPVTGQPLGAMGQPVKVMYKGRAVFLCCTGCKKFHANPEEYVKKLDEKK